MASWGILLSFHLVYLATGIGQWLTAIVQLVLTLVVAGASPTLEAIARAGQEQMEETRRRSQQNLALALSNKLVRY
jgi:hypothetical protein